MTTASNPKRLEVLRYCYALIGVLAVSAAFAMLALLVFHGGERKLRERLEQFHLRGAMLTAEAAHDATALQG